MNDLIVASMILGVLTLMALASGLMIGRRGSFRLRIWSEIIGVTLLVAYMATIWNRPAMVALLPTSAAVIVANWLPMWGGFFVGIYANSSTIGFLRRSLVTSVTIVLAGYSVVAPLFGTPPECSSRHSQSALQFQTTPYTCSPAAAATVLKLHGIAATEKELAELCLTREGTHWLGLYRGLKVKTAGTQWKVVAEQFSAEAIRRRSGQPCVLSLNIDTSAFEEDVEHGFVDGRGHSVVYLQSSGDECLTVFDPSPDFGIEIWNDRILDCVSSGVILRLESDDKSSAATFRTARRTAQVAAGNLTAGL